MSDTTSNRRSRYVSGAVLIVLIVTYVALMLTRSPTPIGTQGPMIGRQLPYLKLEGLAGGASDVSLADLQGRVTLLNYWGTWCPPCVRELPEIVAIGEQFSHHNDFRLIAVTCGQAADIDLQPLLDETATFLTARGVKLPIYADHNAASRQAISLVLGTPFAYPTTLVLDRQGTIRGFWQGYHPRASTEMQQLIETLLNETD
jgi:cytochrome c biogenesis protein CcmG/thiol:disulfide interchange protein DsbE